MGSLLAERTLTMPEHEIRTVTTLEKRAAEIKRAITDYERYLGQARADLASVTATIALFKEGTTNQRLVPYERWARLFRAGEVAIITFDVLKDGPLDTRQLAVKIMERKGLDTGDKVLVKVITNRLIHTLGPLCRRGKLADGGKRLGVRVWTLPAQPKV
jgi:hypothetical protein